MALWTGRLVAVLLLLIVVAADVEARKAKSQKRPDISETTNFLLGLDYSHWLVGPLYYIATEEERTEFLGLSSDDEAEAFIAEFWRRRNPSGSDLFGNDLLSLYEKRVAEADKRYRESTTLGRRTDRGSIYVLYGEPESIEYDLSSKPREPDLEVWSYPRDAPEGLDGAQPKRRYWFAEMDGRTVLYTPRATRRTTMIERQR